MRSLQRSGFIRALSLAVLILACPALALAAPSNKWRIQVSSDADSDGVVVFRVAPTDAAPVDIAVQVRLGDRYRIEIDDGEDVLLKKHYGGADFDLTITQKTAAGVRITLDRE